MPSTLPTTEEVNALMPHYAAIQKKLAEWQERDPNKENEWLYIYAQKDIKTAWQQVYRMGVRYQLEGYKSVTVMAEVVPGPEKLPLDFESDK